MLKINFECGICHHIGESNELLVKEMMFGTRTEYTYLQCEKCGTLQIKHPVTDPGLLYPGNYYSLQQNQGFVSKLKEKMLQQIVMNQLGIPSLFGNILNKISPFTIQSTKNYIQKNSRILDLGCGKGELLKILCKIGFKNLEGLDPYIKETVIEKDYTIFKAFPNDFTPNKKYDIIMLNHSFEHMDNPDLILSIIKDWVTDNGAVIIRIPVADCYCFENYGENWMQIDAPRHIYLHTNKSMKLLAERNKWSIEIIIDDSLYYHLIGSEQYMRNISVYEKGSFFPLMKSWLMPWLTVFTKKDIKKFKVLANKLNKSGRGDQRAFVLRKSS